MRDFTLNIYRELLSTLLNSGFEFYVLKELCAGVMKEPYIVLRHDVDRKPENALRMAEIENNMGVKATYYFRIVKKVFDPEIIKKISAMGHEVGYHYEDLSMQHGDIEEALKSFKRNVEMLRELVPVNTVSMHGNPLSKYDNRKLTTLLNFTELDILCEPYSIVEKLRIVYLTDTGRSWNNSTVNVRDKVSSTIDIKVKSTHRLIDAIGKELSEKNMMLNIHPERWEDAILPWFWNLMWQRFKNVIKYTLIKVNYGR